MKKTGILLLTLLLLKVTNSFGQDGNPISGQLEGGNPITTAVPFLMIAPDSRGGSMGDAGVAVSPDGYSQHWNSSKLAFIESPMGVTISYTPWLKKLVDDMNLAYVSGYYRLDEMQTIGVGLRYFSMGNINFTDGSGYPLGNFSPHEFAIDVSYNRKLSKKFSLGIAPRFILSNLTGGVSSGGGEALETGKSVAMDINGYYNDKMKLGDYDGRWAAGFNISNIGAKLGYSEDSKNFIPTNLRIGGSMTIDLDEYNSITATLDLNKLLVPTPPIYYTLGEETGNGPSDGSNDPSNIKYGMDANPNNIGVFTGMIQSFYDAPNGFKEEMQEISYAGGLEYWYAKQFAVRAGYFHEHANKGNRKYFTAGVGLKMNVFGIDFAYLIPTGATANSPLSNTWRFSLVFDLDSFNNQ